MLSPGQLKRGQIVEIDGEPVLGLEGDLLLLVALGAVGQLGVKEAAVAGGSAAVPVDRHRGLLGAGTRQRGILAQEAVAGMQRVTAGRGGGLNDLVDRLLAGHVARHRDHAVAEALPQLGMGGGQVLVTIAGDENIIFGGEKKLDRALCELIDEYQPKAAFVYSTCIVGVMLYQVFASQSYAQVSLVFPSGVLPP